MKESSLIKITWGYIWRLLAWTICLSIVLGFLLNLLLGAVANKYESTVLQIEATIRFYRMKFVLTILIDIIICFVACRFATSDIIKKFDVNSNKACVIRNITIVVITVALLIIVYQVVNVNFTIEKLDASKKILQNVTTYFADENDVSDFAKVSAFIEWIKGIIIVSVLAHAAVFIAIIGFERKWLEEA